MAAAALARAQAGGAPGDVKRTVTLLSQHQLSSLVATGVDYCVMIVCVSVFGLTPVLGTVLGALCGAVTSFRHAQDDSQQSACEQPVVCAGINRRGVVNESVRQERGSDSS